MRSTRRKGVVVLCRDVMFCWVEGVIFMMTD